MSDQTLPKPSKNNVVRPSSSNQNKTVEITKPSNTSSSSSTNTTSTKVPTPPTSLSALSSMSSSSIPKKQTNGGMPKPTLSQTSKPLTPTKNNEKIVVKPPTTQVGDSKTTPITQPSATTSIKPPVTNTPPPTTVLGKPLPQVIRGETTPKGLTTPMTVVPTPAKVLTPNKTSTDNSVVKKPEIVEEKKSILRFLPIILGGLVIVAIVGFVLSKIFATKKTASLPKEALVTTPPTEQVAKRTEVVGEEKEITYWGLWESTEVLEEIITQFEQDNVGVKIKYIKQSPKNYRERLQSSLGSEQGPDLFRFHASWTPMLASYLSPIPSSVVSAKEFKDNYYPVVSEQLVSKGQFVGVPLMYDGLALFYNEDIFKTANVTPPSTWAELRLLAQKLTVKSATGIERAGLAIGNASNVEHFSDILAVLMLQNGADFTKPNSQETKDALLFYTNFVTKDGVWNEKLPTSTVAFARGDVAMMFAPSWRAHDVKAQNPNLKFKTMTLPQLSDKRVAWASFWAEGINAKSKNQEIVIKFLAYLNTDENLKKLYSKASETRSFGEIYPKISMANELASDTVVASYLNDAPYAKGWYLNSFTHDNGVNDQMINYYKDAVNSILQHEDIEDVMETLETGVKQVLKQYKIK